MSKSLLRRRNTQRCGSQQAVVKASAWPEVQVQSGEWSAADREGPGVQFGL